MWLTYRGGEFAGRNVEVTGSSFTLGRDDSCDLTVEDERVSRQHARITVLPDGTTQIEDLGSSNGTMVNGQRITGPVALSGGEQIQLGSTTLLAAATQPSGSATVFGETPAAAGAAAAPGGASPSVIQRIKDNTQRTKIAVGLGAAALAVVILIAVLAVAGVFSGSGDDEPSTAEIVDNLRPSTALVIPLQGGEPQGSGTGWVLDADEGLVVTNAHVTNAGETFRVIVNGDPSEASILAAAPCDDLAVLRVEDTTGLATLPLADSQSDLREGDTVVAVGFPGSASEASQLTVTEGVVSVAETQFDLPSVDVPQYRNVIQTDAAINPGNSGGPLVNTDSQLVGVNSAGISLLGGRSIENQGYAIGVDRVRDIVSQLRDGNSLAWTGMGFQYVPDPAEAGLPPGFPAGIAVTHTVPSTTASEAGFGETPRYITAVNGQQLDGSLASYCEAVDDGESGGSAQFTYLEAGVDGDQTDEVAFQ